MAQSFAYHIFPQIPPFSGKDKLAGTALTKNNNTLVILHTLTPATAPPVVFALSSVAQYLENDLQRIFQTVLDFGPLVPLPALAPAPQQYKSVCEKPLKSRFSDVYWGKTHLECYNFFQRCEDHYATAGAKSQNRVSFAAIFLKNTTVFCW